MDEFIHWPKPYLFMSATCEEMLSWMIETWMIETGKSFDTIIDVDYWYHAVTCIPDQHW